MSAVGIFLLEKSDNEILRSLRGWTRPYILLTSQWQKWDIFSPDPLRRVSAFSLESNATGSYKTVHRFEHDTLSWWRRPKELKILGRLRDDWNRLTPSYLAYYCAILPVEGADLQLKAREYILPSEAERLRTVSETTFTFTEKIVGSVRCP